MFIDVFKVPSRRSTRRRAITSDRSSAPNYRSGSEKASVQTTSPLIQPEPRSNRVVRRPRSSQRTVPDTFYSPPPTASATRSTASTHRPESQSRATPAASRPTFDHRVRCSRSPGSRAVPTDPRASSASSSEGESSFSPPPPRDRHRRRTPAIARRDRHRTSSAVATRRTLTSATGIVPRASPSRARAETRLERVDATKPPKTLVRAHRRVTTH